MLQIPVCLFLICVLHCASAQKPTDLCAGCVMVNGAGYNDHVDCDKYVQCHDDGTGALVAEVMDCPFATHWDMESLTCLPIGDTPCGNDKCLRLAKDSEYSVATNCRGYMKCVGGKSKPVCCAYNQTYVDGTGCVDDVNDVCNDTCFGVSESTLYPPKCDMFPIAGKPAKYERYVEGWGNLTLDCPIGTLFLKDACACIGLTDVIARKRVCKPEIHLPFTRDHRDESGKSYFVHNEDVVIKNGVAEFNGKNSRLVIPRFTNLEHSTTVVIKIKYSSKHETWTGMARALVSNSDCGTPPSIMLSEDNSNIYFGVGTDASQFVYTFVPQLPINPDVPEKTVEYKFNNGDLMGSNGVETRKKAATGYLRNVRCAIQIGHAENLQPFDGKIDEVSIYLCDPDQP
ncbi:protein PIF-like [Mercenaria mercenaria]|uniref:protein PIF-like n=1 Tax=Mercenaria mercenaria TaxID=6596 RepID=UPI00234F4DD2|nr:protein PIF-like [Mercenaria mercenaria]